MIKTILIAIVFGLFPLLLFFPVKSVYGTDTVCIPIYGRGCPSPSPTVSPSPTPTASPSPTPTPTASPTPSPTPTATPTPTPTASPSPTATPSPTPAASPTPTTTPAAQIQVSLSQSQSQSQSQSTTINNPAGGPLLAAAPGQVAGVSVVKELPKTGPSGALLTLLSPIAVLLIGRQLLRVGRSASHDPENQ